MSNLNTGQKWALAAILASLAGLFVTFFLTGQVQVFGYIVVSFAFAAFAIINSNDRKAKNDGQ
jgi:hypothetical protein